MTDHCLAEDIAKLLLGPDWEQRSNTERIAALAISFDAVTRARETGVRPTADIVPMRRGSHDAA
ncbi:MAG TPA: hypothetical protein DCP69_10110 [Candidatus Omnitrophica bacterium]|nr:hypothetical protein [Candidatus Omnitrophota bacterium]